MHSRKASQPGAEEERLRKELWQTRQSNRLLQLELLQGRRRQVARPRSIGLVHQKYCSIFDIPTVHSKNQSLHNDSGAQNQLITKFSFREQAPRSTQKVQYDAAFLGSLAEQPFFQHHFEDAIMQHKEYQAELLELKKLGCCVSKRLLQLPKAVARLVGTVRRFAKLVPSVLCQKQQYSRQKLIEAFLCRQFACSKAAIFTVEHLVKEIKFRKAQSFLFLGFGEGAAGVCAQSCQLINIKDAYKFPSYCQRFDQLSGHSTKSTLCVPTVTKMKKANTVLQLFNKREKPFYFDQEDELVAVGIAGMVEELVGSQAVLEQTPSLRYDSLCCEVAAEATLSSSHIDLLRRSESIIANKFVLNRVGLIFILRNCYHKLDYSREEVVMLSPRGLALQACKEGRCLCLRGVKDHLEFNETVDLDCGSTMAVLPAARKGSWVAVVQFSSYTAFGEVQNQLCVDEGLRSALQDLLVSLFNLYEKMVASDAVLMQKSRKASIAKFN